MLNAVTHGGGCCGITHLYGFGHGPGALNHMEPNYPGMNLIVPKKYDENHGISVKPVNSRFNPVSFIHAEKAIDRFPTILKFVKAKYKNGIIEAILAQSTQMYYDQMAWAPVLEKHGFKMVSNCYNSNSANRVYVFHYTTDNEGDKLRETDEYKKYA